MSERAGSVAAEGGDGEGDGLVGGAVDRAFLGEGRGRVRPVGAGEPVVKHNHMKIIDAAIPGWVRA